MKMVIYWSKYNW